MTVEQLIQRLSQFDKNLPVLFATSWREPRFEAASFYEHYDVDRHSSEMVLFIDLEQREQAKKSA